MGWGGTWRSKMWGREHVGNLGVKNIRQRGFLGAVPGGPISAPLLCDVPELSQH